MNTASELERLEQVIDTSGVAPRLELLLPVGVRPRQLRVRTLLAGMLLIAVHGRPAHLRRVHHALLDLPHPDQQRLGILAQWRTGPHPLTYRQLERTFGLLTRALSKPTPDGAPPSSSLNCSTPCWKQACRSSARPRRAATPWTGPTLRPGHAHRPNPARAPQPAHHHQRRPPPAATTAPTATRARESDGNSINDDSTNDSNDNGNDNDGDGKDRGCADPEASWGHRNTNHPARNETFYGYYLQAATTVKDEQGPQVPELARRMLLTSCHIDPPAALVPVIERMTANGITISDLLADSGYAYRVPAPGRCRSNARASTSSRTCTPTTAAPTAPTTARPAQREPLLPRHPTSADRHLTAAARRERRTDRRPRPALRRARQYKLSRSPPTTATATTA